MIRKFLFILSVLALSINTVQAGETRSLKTARGNIYSAGGSVLVAENTTGDIISAGGNVVITGSAGNEVLAAGGSVTLLGKTGGDARIAGGNVTIDTVIEGEAMIAGGHITLSPGSIIKSDLFAAAGEISLEGSVLGNAKIIGGTVTINGTINKDVNIKARRVIIGSNAVINGNLRYAAPEAAAIGQGAVIRGKKIFLERQFSPPRVNLVLLLTIWWGIKFLALTATTLAVYFLLQEKAEAFTVFALNRFGNELMTGFIVLIVIPVLVTLLFMTVFGSLFALVGLSLYIAFSILSYVLGALVFSGLLGKYLFKKEPPLTWMILVFGIIIYEVIGLIPFIGWIVTFVFFLAALGTLSHLVYLHFKKGPSSALS